MLTLSRYYWGDVVDGIFSWESAWPERMGVGGLFPGDVSVDLLPLKGAHAHNAPYMMGLSPMQYKDSVSRNEIFLHDLSPNACLYFV